MKIRNLLLALAVVAVAPAAAEAQCAAGTCTEVLDITGTIASNVTASAVTPMAFSTIAATGETAVGQFSVVANQATSVSVVVSSLVNGAASISLTAACSWGGADFAAGTAFTGGLCGSTPLAAGSTALWVQGTVSDLSGATLAGNYTGTATLSVTYTNF